MAAWLFLAPSLGFFLVFTAAPVVAALGISFTRWDLFTDIAFVGVANYAALAGDAIFRKVFGNTGYFVLAAAPIQMALAFLCALGLNRGIVGQSVFRVLYFLPVVSSTVAVALIWSWIFNGNFGLLNAGLSLLGVEDPPRWLGSSNWAMPAVIIVSVWHNLGTATVLFLAGLQNLPKDVYAAAAIDGATGWRRTRHITLPLLSPTTFFVLIITIINSFQVFELVYIMTKAGPANATNTLVYYIFQNAFQFYRMGTASAAAMILSAIVLVLTLIQYRLQRRWVHYG